MNYQDSSGQPPISSPQQQFVGANSLAQHQIQEIPIFQNQYIGGGNELQYQGATTNNEFGPMKSLPQGESSYNMGVKGNTGIGHQQVNTSNYIQGVGNPNNNNGYPNCGGAMVGGQGGNHNQINALPPYHYYSIDQIPKFGRAFQLPTHLDSIPQNLRGGAQITCELKFLNSITMSIINSMGNIPLPPILDPDRQQFFSKQNLYCQFSIPTQTIIVECSLSLPSQPKRKVRGQVNLAEFTTSKQAACIYIDIPESPVQQQSVSIFGDDTSNVAQLYLQFNVSQLSQSEYLLADLFLQVEYTESAQVQNLIQIAPTQYPPQVLGGRVGGHAQPHHQHSLNNMLIGPPGAPYTGYPMGTPSGYDPQQHQQQIGYPQLQRPANTGSAANAPEQIVAPRPYQQIQGQQPLAINNGSGQAANLYQQLGVESSSSKYGYQINQQTAGQYIAQPTLDVSQLSQPQQRNLQPQENSEFAASKMPNQQTQQQFLRVPQSTTGNQLQPSTTSPSNYVRNTPSPNIQRTLSSGSLGSYNGSYTQQSQPTPPQTQSSPQFQSNVQNFQQTPLRNDMIGGGGLERSFNQQINISPSQLTQQNLQDQSLNSFTQGPAQQPIQISGQPQATLHQTNAYPGGGGQYNGAQVPTNFKQGPPQNNMQGFLNPNHQYYNQTPGPDFYYGPPPGSQNQQPPYYQQNFGGNIHQGHTFRHPSPNPGFNNIMAASGYPPVPSQQDYNMNSLTMMRPPYYQHDPTQAPMTRLPPPNVPQQQHFRPPPPQYGPNQFGNNNSGQGGPGSPDFNNQYGQMHQGFIYANSYQSYYNGPPPGYYGNAIQQPPTLQNGSPGSFQQDANNFNPLLGISALQPSTLNNSTDCTSIPSSSASQLSGNLATPQPTKQTGGSGSSNNLSVKNTTAPTNPKAAKKKLTAADKRSLFFQRSANTQQYPPAGKGGSLILSESGQGNISSSSSISVNSNGGHGGHGGQGQFKSERLDKTNVPFHCIVEVDTASSNSSQSSPEIPHLMEIVDYLCTQKGSRTMQEYLKKAPINSINLIIEKIKNDFGKLMSDSYGNYFCQTLVRSVSTEQRLKILKALTDEFVTVACDNVGTHSMQRLVEIVCEDAEKMVIYNSICNSVERLAFHHKGNYVLLTIISVMRGELLTHIIDKMLPRFPQLMLDQLGICLVNKAIQLTSDNAQIKKIVLILAEHIVATIQSPFGNYAITTALESWGFEVCNPIMEKIKENFAQYAQHKFASNVIEKCVERADSHIIQEFKALIFEGEQPQNIIRMLIRLQHSFFIVQKIYTRLEDEGDREKVLRLLQENQNFAGDKLIKSKIAALINKGHTIPAPVVSGAASSNSNDASGGIGGSSSSSAFQPQNQVMGDPQTIVGSPINESAKKKKPKSKKSKSKVTAAAAQSNQDSKGNLAVSGGQSANSACGSAGKDSYTPGGDDGSGAAAEAKSSTSDPESCNDSGNNHSSQCEGSFEGEEEACSAKDDQCNVKKLRTEVIISIEDGEEEEKKNNYKSPRNNNKEQQQPSDNSTTSTTMVLSTEASKASGKVEEQEQPEK